MAETAPRSLNEAHDKIGALHSCLSKLAGNQQNFDRAFEVSLLCIMHQMADSILLLEREDKTFDAHILLRSLLEHLVELKLLRHDPKRHLNHKRSLDEGTKKLLLEAHKNNPFMIGVSEAVKVGEELVSVESRISGYRVVGAKSTTVKADWDAAGMSNEYEAAYRMLSDYVHPKLAGAIGRGIMTTGSSPSIELQPLLCSSTHAVVADTLCGVLSEAIEVAEELLG